MSQTGSSGRGAGRGGEPPLPETIDHYTIARRIGRGGQGDVFLAHDPNLDIDVALKVLHAEFRAEEFIERFKVEARTAVRLTAPNIVRVFNFNPAYPYLVMEYCGDGDLDRLIKARRQIPLTRSVHVVRQICDALVAAHGHKPPILHRDLKPGNVLFQGDVPKVADFGLAKMLGATSTGLTKTSGMMGTVGYASPEQLIDASKVDHLSDVWSLGVILYELLTFRRPFEKPGDDYVNVAIKVRMEPPAEPPFELPKPIWDVVLRTLSKDSHERYGSARELSKALGDAVKAVPDAENLLLPPESVLREIDRLAAEAADYLDRGSTKDAESVVEAMKQASRDDPLARYWSRRLREAREIEVVSASDATVGSDKVRAAQRLEGRLNSIQDLIGKREFRDARRRVGELLVEEPDNSVVQGYLEKIARQESALGDALNRAHEEAEAARRAGDPTKVHGIWKALLEEYPGLPDVEAELAVAAREIQIQEARRHHQAVKRTAERLREMGDTEGAVAAWDAHLAEHPHDTEAVAARGALVAEKKAAARAERLRSVDDETRRLRDSGDPAGALALWENYLREDPDSPEAAEQIGALRAEIDEQRERQALEGARQAAGQAGDDASAALRAWSECLRQFPGNEEAKAKVEQLRGAIADRELEALRAGVERQASVLEARLRGDRYRSLPKHRARVASAMESSRTAADGAALEGARQALESAGRDAEAGLAKRVGEARSALLDAVADAREHLSSDDAGADDALEKAFVASVAALCEGASDRPIDDPVEPVKQAAAKLDRVMGTLAAKREQAIHAARAGAGAALAAAATAVNALPVEGFGELRAELADLQKGQDSTSTARLADLSARGSSLQANAETAGMSDAWTALGRLRTLYGESLELLPSADGGRLSELCRSASLFLDPGDGTPAPSGEEISVLSRELGAEIAAFREARETAAGGARERWKKALDTWSRVPAERLDEELVARAETVKQAARAALDQARFGEIQALARQVESLARRGELQAAWDARKEAVRTLEGPVDDDGVPAGPADKAGKKVLAGYRKALADGEVDRIEAIGQQLVDQAQGAKAPADAGRPGTVPELDPASRELNHRYHASALERFDQAVAAYEQAKKKRSAGDAARYGAEATRIHDKLLRPVAKDGRRVGVMVAAVAAVVIIALGATGYFMMGRGDDKATIAVVSASGEVRVAEVQRDGKPVTDLTGADLTVPESGVQWELEPGNYRLKTEDGREIDFEVPATAAVGIPGSGTDYAAELVKELDLESIVGAGGG